MITTWNAENLQQYKSWFSLIVEQILVFVLSTNLAGEIRMTPNFNQIA